MEYRNKCALCHLMTHCRCYQNDLVRTRMVEAVMMPATIFMLSFGVVVAWALWGN